MTVKLGSTIKYVREAKGLTQRAAAGVLGVSDVHLCNLEHNKARPSTRLLQVMEEAWGVDVYVVACCCDGDWERFPKAIRGPMRKLAAAWRAEIEG